MRKRLFAMFLIVVLLIAAFGLSCEPTEKGTIEVEATLDGDPWTGAVDYTLTPGVGSPFSGTDVPGSYSMDAGTWTCSYEGGGPDGADLVGIAPSETQELPDGGTITFTFNFEIPETDASITFVSWSIDGEQVSPGSYTVYPPTTIDAEYDIFLAGNSSEWVTVNATFKVVKHYLGENEYQSWHVANAPGSVSTAPPAQNLTHEASVNGVIHPICYEFDVFKCHNVTFDVVVSFKIRKGTNYRTKTNWFGYRGSGPDDIIFDTDSVRAGVWGMDDVVTTWGCVYVEGDVDPTNDCSSNSSMLSITYDYLGSP
ncbi:MAG: hypothetical protein J7L92_02695 [Dehalococcoidia bacterium]|nr:hypothetical protein [Dehalococcoidia bacterium]